MPIDHVRNAAIDVLLRVFERGAYLNDALDKTLRRKRLADRSRRFLTHLVYGTVRYKLLCDHVLTPLLHQPLKKLPAPIKTILRMGVYQGLFLDQVTRPAMVHTSVDLAKKRGHAGTARLVNAVLKKVPPTLDDVSFPDKAADLKAYLSARYSIPPWLAELWAAEHGEEGAEALCAASNSQAPTTIRINTMQTSPDALTERLHKAGLSAQHTTPLPEELTLTAGPPPARSKLFGEGEYILQDPASMLPPHLLEPEAGQRILDMCAAPGGKTTHLAQLTQGNALVVAADAQARRLGRLRDNVERLQLPGVCALAASGLEPPFGEKFDRILVDAPCSGLGTLRRHPDLKWRGNAEDIARLAEMQTALLRSAIGLCENQGIIVYSVCTFTRQETEQVVAAVVDQEPVEREDGPEWLTPWKIGTGMYRTLPSEGPLDGFFLTRLRKRS